LGRAAVGVAILATVSGCGFVHAGRTSHTKPDGFVLRGYVTVAGAVAAGPVGSACQSPPAAADIRANAPVRVASPDGRALASGQLGAGVLAMQSETYRCNFPFEIRAVPGGPSSYVITVGSRPPQAFAAMDLREDRPAVILISGAPAGAGPTASGPAPTASR
jgi:hypothetical protein